MLTSLLKKVFGSKNDRELKRMGRIVKQINELEPRFEALSDSELKGMTESFRKRLDEGSDLDQLLPEAFRRGPRDLQADHGDAPL